VARFRQAFAHFDAVRVDHFLGFHRMWEVPARAATARHGRWIRTPGQALLQAVTGALGPVQIIAEDLGAVTPEALALRDEFGFPGMRVLQFAFGDDGPGSRYHQPHSYPRNCAVYPGTHDNETAVGWFTNLRAAAKKKARRQSGRRVADTPYERVLRYTGTSGGDINWDLIRIAAMSVADLAIVPVQCTGSARARKRGSHELPRPARGQLAMAPAAGGAERQGGQAAAADHRDIRPRNLILASLNEWSMLQSFS